MFASSVFGVAAGIVFVVLLGLACLSDIRSRRISNQLVLVTATLGLAYAYGHMGRAEAMLSSLGAVGVGLAIWLPCYALGMMGAGDVKFFAAASAWLGPQHTLYAAALSAIFGGLLALGWVVWSRSGTSGAELVSANASILDATHQGTGSALVRKVRLPYGVAMAAGLAVVAWFPNILR